jgi:hypothetical protein
MNDLFGRLLLTLLCLSVTSSALPAVAQQNNNAPEFDLSATAEIRGQAVRIWTQPPFIIVSVTEDGQVKSWRIEFGNDGNPSAGVPRLLATLKLGDTLVVTGNPSISPGDLRLRATSISRPGDDFVWQR